MNLSGQIIRYIHIDKFLLSEAAVVAMVRWWYRVRLRHGCKGKDVVQI